MTEPMTDEQLSDDIELWSGSHEPTEVPKDYIYRLCVEIRRLRAEVADTEKAREMHAEINRRTAEALGKPHEGEGSSWHDIPEWVALNAAFIEGMERGIAKVHDKLAAHEKAIELARAVVNERQAKLKHARESTNMCRLERAIAQLEEKEGE